MHSIAPHNVEDLGIFLAVRAEGLSALGDIPEKVFDLHEIRNYQVFSA